MNKKRIRLFLTVVISLSVYFVLSNTKIIERLMNRLFHGNEMSQCTQGLSSTVDQVAFMWELVGIKASDIDAAKKDLAVFTCECIQDKAKGKSLMNYINNRSNLPLIKKCSEVSNEKIISKYVPTD